MQRTFTKIRRRAQPSHRQSHTSRKVQYLDYRQRPISKDPKM